MEHEHEERGIVSDAMVTLEGKPFVQLRVDGKPVGQLTPNECMALGLRCIMSGIEAERDAGFVRGMKDAGGDEETVGALLTMIRSYRDSSDPADPEKSIFHPRFPH